MAMIDPEQERRRLAEVYSAQSDGELEQAAGQSSELTDVAREALRAELGKRGLYIGQMENAPAGYDTAEFRDLITLRTFLNLAEAELAKGLLEASGIEAFLFDENMGRVYWMNVTGGVKLRVDAENAQDASRILDQSVSEFTTAESDAQDDADATDPDPST